MFEEWFNSLRRLFFWWLPSEDRDPRRGTDAPKADEHRSADTTASAEVAPGPSAGETTAAAAAAEDDLTEIKGIGPALAKRLRNIGVTSFDHLAAADPEDLAHRLQTRPVTPERVRAWIEAAALRRGRRG